MTIRRALPSVVSITLIVLLTAGEALARKEALLRVSQGQLPSDTATDATRLSLEEKAELGAKALKVVYAGGESFGDRVARITDWKPFISLQFDALNPSQETVHLTLTVRHRRTTSYQTRVDVPVVLRPGRNAVKIGVDDPRRPSGRSYIYVQGVNLSDYGVAIHSPQALQKNASLWLRLADGCATRCWVPARVVHTKRVAAGYMVGLEFLFNRSDGV